MFSSFLTLLLRTPLNAWKFPRLDNHLFVEFFWRKSNSIVCACFVSTIEWCPQEANLISDWNEPYEFLVFSRPVGFSGDYRADKFTRLEEDLNIRITITICLFLVTYQGSVHINFIQSFSILELQRKPQGVVQFIFGKDFIVSSCAYYCPIITEHGYRWEAVNVKIVYSFAWRYLTKPSRN